MTSPARIAILVLLPFALSGCFVKVSGLETTGGGTRATTTSTQVAGAARFSHGSASFSSGPRVSPGAPGGHATLGKGAAGVLIVGLVVADLWNYLVGPPQPKPLSPDERIMDTCSCYQKPAMSDER
jgi:hypothetical protein